MSTLFYDPKTPAAILAEQLAKAMRASGKWWRTREKILLAVTNSDLFAVETPSRLSAILRSPEGGISFAGEPVPADVLEELARLVIADFPWLLRAAGERPRDPLIGYAARPQVRS